MELIYEKLPELIKPGCTIVEIGAHIGTDTARLYDLLKPARYIAIEPDIRNIKKLLGLNLPLTIIGAAASNINGIADFYYSQGQTRRGREHTDSSSLMQPLKQPSWVTFEKGYINCFRLDDLGIEHIDLIWMDVQGAELLVIEGAAQTLRQTRLIYTECQEGRYHDQPGLQGIMAALPGWEMILKNGDNVLLNGPDRA